MKRDVKSKMHDRGYVSAFEALATSRIIQGECNTQVTTKA
ncbi:hypothetical protein ABIB90_008218 [Bradyrhizobium sp. JR4.1]